MLTGRKHDPIKRQLSCQGRGGGGPCNKVHHHTLALFSARPLLIGSCGWRTAAGHTSEPADHNKSAKCPFRVCIESANVQFPT
jgi:hypothetical protein